MVSLVESNTGCTIISEVGKVSGRSVIRTAWYKKLPACLGRFYRQLAEVGGVTGELLFFACRRAYNIVYFVLWLARIELVVADSKGIGAG